MSFLFVYTGTRLIGRLSVITEKQASRGNNTNDDSEPASSCSQDGSGNGHENQRAFVVMGEKISVVASIKPPVR